MSTGTITIVTPTIEPAEAEQVAIVEAAKAIVVTSQDEHAEAIGFLQRVASAKKKVEALFSEPKRAAHAAHKSITAAEKKLLDPLDAARALVQRKALAWEDEARRRAAEEQRRRQEEIRRQEEERRLQDAIAAAEEGDEEEAEAILDEPAPVPAVHVAPAIATVSGVSSRSTWRAEVADLKALVRFVADNPEWTHLLLPNTVGLNGLARSQKGQLAIPGVRAVEERGMAVGAGR